MVACTALLTALYTLPESRVLWSDVLSCGGGSNAYYTRTSWSTVCCSAGGNHNGSCRGTLQADEAVLAPEVVAALAPLPGIAELLRIMLVRDARRRPTIPDVLQRCAVSPEAQDVLPGTNVAINKAQQRACLDPAMASKCP
jgi:hypothetical protein